MPISRFFVYTSMKIRIGTDLNLLVNVFDSKNPKQLNIHSLEAFLINTSVREKIDKEINKKTRFISRFPIEPMHDAYLATEYNIHCSGYPNYRIYPHEVVHPSYAGFGVNPVWSLIYPKKPCYRFTEYKAKTYATTSTSKVLITFPAEDQLFCGNYSIIVVVKYYMKGYGNNLKTVTMDINDAFTLVDNSEEEDLTSTERVQLVSVNDPTGDADENDIFVNAGELAGSSIHLDYSVGGTGVDIDMSRVIDWYDGD